MIAQLYVNFYCVWLSSLNGGRLPDHSAHWSLLSEPSHVWEIIKAINNYLICIRIILIVNNRWLRRAILVPLRKKAEIKCRTGPVHEGKVKYLYNCEVWISILMIADADKPVKRGNYMFGRILKHYSYNKLKIEKIGIQLCFL